MVTPKTIAIDFDNTFTADQAFWAHVIEHAKKCGHRPIIVTARRNTEENIELINRQLDLFCCQCPVYLTGLRSKIAFMEERGIAVDFWCDDDPKTLVHGHC